MDLIIKSIASLWPVLLIVLLGILSIMYNKQIKFALTNRNVKLNKGDISLELGNVYNGIFDETQPQNYQGNLEEDKLLEDKSQSSIVDKTWENHFWDNEYTEAIKKLENLIMLENDKSELIKLESYLGLCLSKIDFAKGVEKFKSIVQSNSNIQTVYIKFSKFYDFYDLIEEAISIINEGLVKFPNDIELQKAKTEYLIKSTSFEQAELLLKELLKGNESNSELHMLLANVYKGKGNKELVIQEYEEALKLEPLNEEILSDYAFYIYNNNKNNEEGLFLYKKLVNINPQAHKYHALLGNIYLNLNMYNKALESYEIANKLSNEKEGWILANIGNLYYSKELYSKSIEYLKKALLINPEDNYTNDRISKAIEKKKTESEKEEKIINKIFCSKRQQV